MKYHILLFIAAALVAQEPGPTRPNTREFLGLGPAPDAAAAKLGETHYEANCAACHGKNARGAQGPNLIRSTITLHDEKGEALGLVIREGRPQAGMPSFPNLTEAQAYEIAEYIHLQVELAANRGTYRDTYGNLRNQVTGDAAQGRRFFAANCSGCHSVSGDLAAIGARYPQASVMLARIAWPVSSKPAQVTVMTQSGETINGVLVRADDFDVSVRDSDGNYHNWPRSEIKLTIGDQLAGHRALLDEYTDADLHNLTAYLVSVK